MMQFSDPQYALNPYTRHNYAYREWQRLSAIKEAQSHPSRSSTTETDKEEEEEEKGED